MKGPRNQVPEAPRRGSLSGYALLSMGAAVVTMGVKASAFLFTGSISLLSDAVESVVNLVGATFAFFMLRIAARPADEDHQYGHAKAEYFASMVEAVLILVAALGILGTAIDRLMNPKTIDRLGIGLVISLSASLVNLVVGRILITTGRKRESITLEADGQHLMTDVWTSVAIGAGIVLVMLTGWTILDPIAAILVAVNILWTVFRILRRSVAGFMDSSLSKEDMSLIEAAMEKHRTEGEEFHALRTRQAASAKFVSVHLLLDGGMPLAAAHRRAERFEQDLASVLPGAVITVHLEPAEDELSHADENERP